LKKLVSTHMINGRVKITYERIIAGMGCILRVVTTAYRPDRTATPGT